MIKHKVMKSEIVRISGIKVACPTERNSESFFCDAELSEFIYRPDLALLLLLSRFSRVQLCATPETTAHQAPPSLGFSRQEHWSGLPFPSPKTCARMFKAALLSSSLLLKLIKHAQGREAVNFPCYPRVGVGVTEFRFCLEEKCKFLCT